MNFPLPPWALPPIAACAFTLFPPGLAAQVAEPELPVNPPPDNVPPPNPLLPPIEGGEPPSAVPEERTGVDPGAPPAAEEGRVSLTEELKRQGNTIVGLIFDDGPTAAPLGDVTVFSSKAGRGAQTDSRGEFVITDLPVGEYDLIISKVGYIKQEIRLYVSTDRASVVKLPLKSRPIEESDVFKLDAVEIFGEAPTDQKQGLFNPQELQQLVASIGSADFSNKGLGDVGAAVKTAAGANIVGGKYAVIRGLGDRYSNTLVDGAIVPSADPSRKAVQLDLFPTDLVERIDIVKTFSPDMPGEFAGGSVNIIPKRFPSERILSFSYGIKANNQTTGQPIYLNPDRRMDFLGDAPGSDLPADLAPVGEWPGGAPRAARRPSEIPIIEALRQPAVEQWGLVHNRGSMFQGGVAENAPFNTSMDLSIGDAFEIPMGEFGVMLNLTRGRKYTLIPEKEVVRAFRPSGPGTPILIDKAQTQTESSEEVEWGLLASAGIRPTKNHEVAFSFFRYRSAQDEVTQGRRVGRSNLSTEPITEENRGFFVQNYLGAPAIGHLAFDEIGYLDRNLEIVQLSGRHDVNGKDGPRVDWVMSRANSSELRPDSRFLALYELDYADPALLEIEGINPSTLRPELGRVLTVRNITRESNTEPTFREFLSTEEQGDNVRADLTVPFIYDPQKKDSPRFTAKIGLNRFVRERSVRGRLFTYLTGSNAAPNDQAGVDFLSSGKVNSPEVIDGYRFNSAASQGYEVRDLTTAGQTVRNVDASTLLEAGYLMGTAKVGKIELMAGVRLEREERDFYIIPELNPAGVADATNLPEPIANDYALPAASLNWSFGKDDSHKLRLSYGKTVARPTFYEFAPIRIVDQGTGDDIRGNPELTDTLIDNFDLRWEWFPDPKEFAGLEMMAVSLFHKNLDSPIMTTRQGNLRSWQNFGSGTLQGIEFELQKRLFDDFTVSTNFTYIDSLVTPGLEQLNAGVSTASVFEGQPTYIYNFSLGYENKKLGLNANLVYNFTSEILDSITGDVFTPNVYKEPTHSLDLILSKKIRLGEVEGKLKFAAENLLDLEERKYYEGENVTFERYKRGRVFSIGISFDF